ncbi:hypothetical protein T484DRAFT_1826013 [Baffinella frigidus]|nr:hypothetical protein T484DRAFT_1826013 [Cryptophyta sp. CCMP2293]
MAKTVNEYSARIKSRDRVTSVGNIAKTVNEYQARIKSVTRKLMACVSELSMYQVLSS